MSPGITNKIKRQMPNKAVEHPIASADGVPQVPAGHTDHSKTAPEVLPVALVDDVADRLDDGHREDERRQSWSMMA